MAVDDLEIADALDAIWKAIDNYAPLANVFKLKLRWDKEQAMLEKVEPSISDLPAISVEGVEMNPEWFTHRVQNLAAGFTVKFWTPDWVIKPGAQLWMRVWKALHRSRPGSVGPTYLETYEPFTIIPRGSVQGILLSDSRDGEGTQVTIGSISVGLSIRVDPYGNS